MNSKPKKRLLRDVKDLPSWFNIEKYRPARNLSLPAWVEQLIVRKFYLDNLEHYSAVEESIDSLSDDNFRSYFPIFDFPDNLCTKSNEDNKPLQQLNLLDYYNIQRGFNTDIIEESSEFMTLPINKFIENFDRSLKRYEKMKEPIINLGIYGSTDYLKIDLNCPAEVLITQFKEYIFSIKKKKNYYKPTPVKWADFGVLPYLDLFIWSNQNSYRISNECMAKALFNETHDAEFVKKTLHPLAMELVSDARIKQLTYEMIEQI